MDQGAYGPGVVALLWSFNNSYGGGLVLAMRAYAEIKLTLIDDYASETYLALTSSDGTAIVSGSDLDNDQSYAARRCVPANDCYIFTISNSGGDGI
jgi:hypothetical protein